MKRISLKIMSLCAASAFATQVFAQSAAIDQEQASQTKDVSSAGSKTEHIQGKIRASELIGSTVSGTDGSSLGQVQDLAINSDTGKIRFALVGQGFMAGQGQTLFPVPWRAVNLKAERQFVLNVDPQKMKSAPTWGSPQTEQPDYIIRIYRFYQLEPETGTGGSSHSALESGQGQRSSSDKPRGSEDQSDQSEHKNQHNQSSPDK